MQGLRPQIKNLGDPDEVLTLEDGTAHTVQVGDLTIGRLVLQPGWRWSKHVRPLAGTDSCQFHHIGLGVSGAAHFVMDDGTEFDVRPGDVFDIPPGHDNWVTSQEPAVSILWGGWRGWGKPPDGDRVLMSLVMSDIEESTKQLSAVGDAAWDRLMERHGTVTREVVERYRGREVDSTGDGFLLAFDGAARAVHAAVDIRRSVSAMGVQVRVGVHTGEVEVVPGGLRGVTVHETARIMSLGTGGDVLLSDITKDLAQGAPDDYEDRGVHNLKGIPRPRHVFAVARRNASPPALLAGAAISGEEKTANPEEAPP
jgi:class 3 adenylate cyclase